MGGHLEEIVSRLVQCWCKMGGRNRIHTIRVFKISDVQAGYSTFPSSRPPQDYCQHTDIEHWVVNTFICFLPTMNPKHFLSLSSLQTGGLGVYILHVYVQMYKYRKQHSCMNSTKFYKLIYLHDYFCFSLHHSYTFFQRHEAKFLCYI